MTKEQEFRKQTEEAKFEAFSVMCEKVNELEKENANLKALRKYELNVSKLEIEKLEKENAELRRDKEDLIFIRNQKAKCMGEDKEQLTKAKEIIRQFLNDYPIITKELLDKLEQFLKEIKEND